MKALLSLLFPASGGSAGDAAAGSTHILVFPADRTSPKEIRVTRRRRTVARCLIAAGLIGAGHYAWLLVSFTPASDVVLEERDALRERARDYAEDTERMAARIETLEIRMRRLAMLAGAEPLGERVGGLGGDGGTGFGYDYVSARLDHLSGRIAALDEQGSSLERTMREKSRLLAQTPSVWPTRGYISSGFGRRADPFTGEIEWHLGLDISTDRGTPVRATADGVVLETSTNPTYGKRVVISHGFGVETRYAHLARIDVRRGQKLLRGQVLGLVGNTGRSQAPHLHYEVWLNERAKNPLDHIVDYAP